MNELDETDASILGVVKQNSRLSVRQIAVKTGVPAATVNRRLNKLVETGVIRRFTAELDYEKLGKKTAAYVLIRGHPGTDYQPVLDSASRNEAVEDMSIITGPFDILLKVRVKDNEDLSDFLFNYAKQFPYVAQTETFMVLNLKNKRNARTGKK